MRVVMGSGEIQRRGKGSEAASLVIPGAEIAQACVIQRLAGVTVGRSGGG